jgi:septal ring factor EnvC (AmiA/AmiB activator)
MAECSELDKVPKAEGSELGQVQKAESSELDQVEKDYFRTCIEMTDVDDQIALLTPDIKHLIEERRWLENKRKDLEQSAKTKDNELKRLQNRRKSLGGKSAYLMKFMKTKFQATRYSPAKKDVIPITPVVPERNEDCGVFEDIDEDALIVAATQSDIKPCMYW